MFVDSNMAIGVIGAGIVLAAFVYNQTGKWKATNYLYDLANFVGSAVLVVYALTIKSWPFVILNSVWAGVSLRDVINSLKSK